MPDTDIEDDEFDEDPMHFYLPNDSIPSLESLKAWCLNRGLTHGDDWLEWSDGIIFLDWSNGCDCKDHFDIAPHQPGPNIFFTKVKNPGVLERLKKKTP